MKFVAKELIGSGSYGKVYRIVDSETNQQYAYKKINFDDPSVLDVSSVRELVSLKKLNHINIIKLIEYKKTSARMDIIMELADFTLTHFIASRKKNSNPDQIVDLSKQLLLGLEFCHANNIIHRDIKPDNILIKKGVLKIADFGLSRMYEKPTCVYTPVVVTLHYRAPELLYKTQYYGPEIDLWSVGCVIAEMYTGKILFCANSELEQLSKIFKRLGIPNDEIWKNRKQLPGYVSVVAKPCKLGIEKLIKNNDATDLIKVIIKETKANSLAMFIIQSRRTDHCFRCFKT